MSNIIIAGKQFNNINKITFDTPDGDIATYILEGYTQPTLITFYGIVHNTSFQAEQGMTWEEWIHSEYNVDNWVIRDDGIHISLDVNYGYIDYEGNNPSVKITDTIIENHHYTYHE